MLTKRELNSHYQLFGVQTFGDTRVHVEREGKAGSWRPSPGKEFKRKYESEKTEESDCGSSGQWLPDGAFRRR